MTAMESDFQVFPGIAETVCMFSQKARVLEVTFS